MNLIRLYITGMLAAVALIPLTQPLLAQSIPNVANSAANAASSASDLANSIGAQGSAGIFGASSAATPAATTTPSTGLLGIGKPRNFPVLRYLAQKRAEGKARLRSSPLGNILKGLLKPISKLTGGVVPAEPTPNHVELNTPGPQGSAARIKQDQINAPKRLAALQELGKVDCNWYPEALAQITLALRHDRSPCVRLEAARLLAACDCCNPQMMFALKTCVEGSTRDGNPPERSEEIQAQAAIALERCLACADQRIDAPAPLLHRPEYPAAPGQIPPADAPNFAPGFQSNKDDETDNNVARVAYNEISHSSADAMNRDGDANKTSTMAEIKLQSRRALENFRQLQSAKKSDHSRSIRDAWRNSK